MRTSISVSFIKKQLRLLYHSLSPTQQDAATDILLQCEVNLSNGDFKPAYQTARKLYKLRGKSPDDAITLFHSLLFAEDVVTANSVVLISEESPYFKSLKDLAENLSFTVKTHKFKQGVWTKDYVVSIGDDVLTPARKKKENYLNPVFVETAKKNDALYYGKLKMDEHHAAKTHIAAPLEWRESSKTLIDQTTFLHRTVLEGGNLFCAINKTGERYYIIGENIISETMAYKNISREKAIEIVVKELGCSKDKLLIIPQWTYHLDLQMAYLGHGQFVIHSFKQKDFNFGLKDSVIAQVKKTFAFLEKKFEESIIETTCKILEKNGFEVTKVFGCLFFLEDCADTAQLKYVPYCKNSDEFDGALALMMNGIALDLGPETGRHFMVSCCNLDPFKAQFATSLRQLGITKIHDVDMLDAYPTGYFEGAILGVHNAQCVSDVAAFMNGGLRCQTSIISQNLSPIFNLEGAKHRLFRIAEKSHLILEDVGRLRASGGSVTQ